MAVEASAVSGRHRYPVRTAEERRRAFRTAERHTRFVSVLRKVLPVFALLVLAAYFISSRMNASISIGDMSASVGGIEIADGNLRMVNPKFEGADKKNGKYVIGADYADQDIKKPNLIKLHAIKADVAGIDGGWSRMTAARGLFDNKTGQLVMRDGINIATSSGVSGELARASLDTKNKILRSHNPVSFVLPNGTVRANALTYDATKRTLTFRGKVTVHMVKPKKEAKPDKEAQKTPEQPALPATEIPADAAAGPGGGEAGVP
jgi:lipopolysaccharide export system protein LptC